MTASLVMSGQGHWQRPARTEEWGWKQLHDLSINSPFFQFVAFPWATLIDSQRREHKNLTDDLMRKALALGPKHTLMRVTLCQHIWAKDLQLLYKTLGITDLFWPHMTRGQTHMGDIRLHPFPLFPVRGFEALTPRDAHSALIDRNVLFNFIGAYDAQSYLTPVRKWILELPQKPHIVIKGRGQWHYEQDVYDRMADKTRQMPAAPVQQTSHALEYDDILQRSLFTLCPSGTGPNSIRFWEAIMFGSIPVLLSDDLVLPGPKDMWETAILRLPETRETVMSLPARLQALAKDKALIKAYQGQLKIVRDTYILKSGQNLILPLSEVKYIQNSLARP